MFPFMQKKSYFLFLSFLEILQRIHKVVISDTLDLPGHAHQKKQQQLTGNSDAFLQTKH